MILPSLPNGLLTHRYRGSEKEQSLNSSKVICSSIDTNYIPLYSIFLNKYYTIRDLPYSIYWIPGVSYDSVTNTDRVVEAFNQATKPIEYLREGITYYIMKHFVYTIVDGEIIVLYSTIIHKDYWTTISNFDNIDKTKLFYLISTNFYQDRFKSFYLHFRKYYLAPMVSHGIDFIYTSDIQKYCFKVVESPLQFPTIASMKVYFNELTQNAIDGFITG